MRLVCVLLGAAYPPLYPNFPLSAMDTPLKYHEQELSYAGIDLKKLIDSGKKVGVPASAPASMPPTCGAYAMSCLETATSRLGWGLL